MAPLRRQTAIALLVATASFRAALGLVRTSVFTNERHHSLDDSIHVNGKTAELSEQGYQQVTALNSDAEMLSFIERLIHMAHAAVEPSKRADLESFAHKSRTTAGHVGTSFHGLVKELMDLPYISHKVVPLNKHPVGRMKGTGSPKSSVKAKKIKMSKRNIPSKVQPKETEVIHKETSKVQAADDFWIYQPENHRDITIREGPHMDGPLTDHTMASGETFRVSDVKDGGNGVLFLKLADGRGWIFNEKPGVGHMCTKMKSALGNVKGEKTELSKLEKKSSGTSRKAAEQKATPKRAEIHTHHTKEKHRAGHRDSELKGTRNAEVKNAGKDAVHSMTKNKKTSATKEPTKDEQRKTERAAAAADQRKAEEEKERKQREEAERKVKEDSEQKAKEEMEQHAKEDDEREKQFETTSEGSNHATRELANVEDSPTAADKWKRLKEAEAPPKVLEETEEDRVPEDPTNEKADDFVALPLSPKRADKEDVPTTVAKLPEMHGGSNDRRSSPRFAFFKKALADIGDDVVDNAAHGLVEFKDNAVHKLSSMKESVAQELGSTKLALGHLMQREKADIAANLANDEAFPVQNVDAEIDAIDNEIIDLEEAPTS